MAGVVIRDLDSVCRKGFAGVDMSKIHKLVKIERFVSSGMKSLIENVGFVNSIYRHRSKSKNHFE